MMRAKGRYRNQTLELDQPLLLPRAQRSRLLSTALQAGEMQWVRSLRSGQSWGCSGWKQSGRMLQARYTTTGRSSMTFRAGDVVLVSRFPIS